MRKVIKDSVKKIVLKLLPDSSRVRSLANRPRFETWRKSNSGNYPVFDERTQMYDYINSEILFNRSVLYLEFGVYEGESIKYFAGKNSDATSRFIGFDTFEGLPEDWIEFSRTIRSKTFNVNGELPKTDDGRISFIKGLFQDTLPIFINKYSSGAQLVIHNDSDLYSSTMYVLTRANDIIDPGTIIIFDEFYSVMHEFRALEDYCSCYMRSYEVIAATNNCAQIAIRMH